MQGALRKYRNKNNVGFTRNYTHLWEQMVKLKAGEKDQSLPGVVQVCVLGKGGDRGQLEIPLAIDADVEYAERLPYPVIDGYGLSDPPKLL